MASRFLVVLILADVFVCLAGANEIPKTIPSSCVTPAPSPTSGSFINSATRKFGSHRPNLATSIGAAPAEAPGSEELHGVEQGQDIYLEKQLHHRRAHAIDRSVAGGGVILGGLATTFLVAVFCYIRATGRKTSEVNVLEK